MPPSFSPRPYWLQERNYLTRMPPLAPGLPKLRQPLLLRCQHLAGHHPHPGQGADRLRNSHFETAMMAGMDTGDMGVMPPNPDGGHDYADGED